MCGILFTNYSCNINEFSDALDLINHRGPNYSSYGQYKSYLLGHNRLKIIDLEDRSNQPFLASDGQTVIIFNGEIYNYKELAKQFNLTLKTTSDTEVLVELYLKLGKDMLQHLNGMFTFVIFNTATQEYFVARDRLGIKPLYYTQANNKVIFSSEISPILSLSRDDKVDEIGLRQYLKLRTFFRGHTIYKNITSFPAGSYMYNNTRSVQYWSLEKKDVEYDAEYLYNLIKSAVKYRMISDVPVGTYLSGGVDSSVISVLAQPKHTWTIGFKDNNEFEYSDLVAKMHNFDHHKILINDDEFIQIAGQMIYKKKDVLSVPNEVLLYKMTNIASKHNTVILSGEGADELFFGYDRIFKWSNENPLTIEGFDKLYSYGTHKDNEIIDYVLQPVMKYSNPSMKIATFFQLYHLHGLLKRLDSSTMLCSVEARVPFCDHRIVEYMYNMSTEIKMKDGIVKYPLKYLYKDILPHKIINRKKVGFPVNTSKIFSTANGMDAWLIFNLKTLFGDDIESYLRYNL